jgi:hypothetical protein
MTPTFQIEEPTELSALIPKEVFTSELSPLARLILLVVFAHGREKISLQELVGNTGCSITRHSWIKYSKELERAGWLIRKNHGSGGRGIWRHERTFLRKPRTDPLNLF